MVVAPLRIQWNLKFELGDDEKTRRIPTWKLCQELIPDPCSRSKHEKAAPNPADYLGEIPLDYRARPQKPAKSPASCASSKPSASAPSTLKTKDSKSSNKSPKSPPTSTPNSPTQTPTPLRRPARLGKKRRTNTTVARKKSLRSCLSASPVGKKGSQVKLFNDGSTHLKNDSPFRINSRAFVRCRRRNSKRRMEACGNPLFPLFQAWKATF